MATPSRLVALSLALILFALLPGEFECVRRKGGDDDDSDDSNDAGGDDNAGDDDDSSTTPAAAVAPKAVSKPTPTKAPAATLIKTQSKKTAAKVDSDDDDDDSSDDSDKDDSDDDSKKEDPVVTGLKAEEKKQKEELAKVEQQLDENLVKQTQANAKLSDITDPAAERTSDREIELAEKSIENETQSPALGKVLGKMWKEMRLYAGPYYTEHLRKKLTDLKAEETTLDSKEKNLRKSLDGTRNKLDIALEGGSVKDANQKTDEEAPAEQEEEKEKKVEEVKDQSEKQVEKKATPAGIYKDDDQRRMHLGIWFAGIIAAVVAVFFLARQR